MIILYIVIPAIIIGMFLLWINRGHEEPAEKFDHITVPFLGHVYFPAGHNVADLVSNLLTVRRELWPSLCTIYGRTQLYHLSQITLVDEMPNPKEHPIAELVRERMTVTLKIGGGLGQTAEYWFAHEVHNLFRYSCGLSYPPVSGPDRVKFDNATDLIKQRYRT